MSPAILLGYFLILGTHGRSWVFSGTMQMSGVAPSGMAYGTMGSLATAHVQQQQAAAQQAAAYQQYQYMQQQQQQQQQAQAQLQQQPGQAQQPGAYQQQAAAYPQATAASTAGAYAQQYAQQYGQQPAGNAAAQQAALYAQQAAAYGMPNVRPQQLHRTTCSAPCCLNRIGFVCSPDSLCCCRLPSARAKHDDVGSVTLVWMQARGRTEEGRFVDT